MLYIRRLQHGKPATRLAQHLAAYALLTDALYREYGARYYQIERDEHGKPYLPQFPDIHVSISHCAGMVACAVDFVPIGVDVERIRTCRPRVLHRAFSQSEQEAVAQSKSPDLLFTQLWTLKESYVKAIGTGIAYPLDRVCFSFSENEILTNRTDYAYTQLLTPDYFILSVSHRAGQNRVERLKGTEEWQCYSWI